MKSLLAEQERSQSAGSRRLLQSFLGHWPSFGEEALLFGHVKMPLIASVREGREEGFCVREKREDCTCRWLIEQTRVVGVWDL